MCGIAGSISKRNDNQTTYIEQMLQKLIHRGPDGNNICQSGPAILGHQRLAILDLSNQATQPMWDLSRRYCVTFNGEIYNFAEIRAQLSTRNYSLNTRSDTEVLINAWAEWGVNVLEKLEGMFAFAIWDSIDQTLFIARDRMGEKPLFYTGFHGCFSDGLIFASELKSLSIHPAVTKKLSLAAISEFLSQNYLLTDTCIFENVFKLPPAHYLVYRLGQDPKIVNYWKLENFFHHKTQLQFSEAKDQLLHLIKKVTTQESYADVDVGAFLSGGLDSSSIVAQMTQENVRTFSIGFPIKSFNELPASRRTAQHLQVSHQTKIISPHIQDLLPKITYACDEPFADTSMIPTYLLAQFARQFVKVCLSGDGGDELFGGYATYQADRMHRYMNKLPKKIIKTMQSFVRHSIRTSFSKLSLDYKLKQFLQGCLYDFQYAHANWRTIFTMEEKIQLFHPEYQSIARIDPFLKIQPFFDRVSTCHPLDQAMYVDMKTWLVDDVLVKVDRTSMANSLEVRSPFLHHSIVEFAASLPVNYKIRGYSGKHILKKSQTNALPKSIINRRKEGFNSPIAFWLNNELYDMAYSITTSNKLLRWFKKSTIESLWEQHKSYQKDNGYRLFGLLNLGLWLEATNI